MASSYATYLGDGVYVDMTPGYVKLYTSNGLEETNVIFLETEVLASLELWLRRVREDGVL